jgi:DnaJ-class molecular chaperone
MARKVEIQQHYEARPVRCPVCDGRGRVPAGFYGFGSASSTSALPEECRTCNGRGYILVFDYIECGQKPGAFTVDGERSIGIEVAVRKDDVK